MRGASRSKIAYFRSIEDSKREHLTKEELCEFEWNFRFKSQAGKFQKKIKIINIPTNNKLTVQITQQQDSLLVQAFNDTSLIELETKHLLLCGPSAYKNIIN